jgi:hypothetical protein
MQFSMSPSKATDIVASYATIHKSALTILQLRYPSLNRQVLIKYILYGQWPRWSHVKRVVKRIEASIRRESSDNFTGQCIWTPDMMRDDEDARSLLDRLVEAERFGNLRVSD